MFRKTIFVVGALVAMTCVSSLTAQARGGHRHAVHYAGLRHIGIRRAAFRPTARRSPRWSGLRSTAHPFGTRYDARAGWHHRGHTLAARRDRMIRRYVGPRSAYAPRTTGAPSLVAPRYVVGGVQTGGASFYSGGRTANGGRVGAATCAHRTLPFGTRVLVTNLANAHQAILTVNDRGPFVRGRIIDVSTVAAAALGMLHSGVASVRVQVVGGPG